MGEILVKYHPNANNDIVGIIESEGGEAVPDLLDFFMYCLKNNDFNYEKMAGSYSMQHDFQNRMKLIYRYRDVISKELIASRRF